MKRLSLAVRAAQRAGQTARPAEMAAIEALIRGAVGADAARATWSRVSARPFVEPVTPAKGRARLADPMPALRIAGLILALVALWFVFGRRLLKRYDAVTRAMQQSQISSLLQGRGRPGGKRCQSCDARDDRGRHPAMRAAPRWCAIMCGRIRRAPPPILKSMIHGAPVQ